MRVLFRDQRSAFEALRLAVCLSVLGTGDAHIGFAAQSDDEEIRGRVLQVSQDGQSVTVEQQGQLLVRYRFGAVPRKPYVLELTSPAGVNVLRNAPADHLHHHGLMFACKANGVDFWGEGADSGSQSHVEWSPTRIAVVRSGEGKDTEPVEVAILRERLRWQTADGKTLLDEERVLTVPAGQNGSPRMLTWESTLSVPSGGKTVTLSGTPYHGLGIRFPQTMDTGGHFRNSMGGVGVAGTNATRAAWCAYAAEPSLGKPVTVAIFDAPTNARHPTSWFTMDKGFAYLAASLGVDVEPWQLEPGQRLTVRYGVAVFDGKVAKTDLDAAYAHWQQLGQEVRTGSRRGLLGMYFAGEPDGKPAAIRVDRAIAFDWSDGMPDERVRAGQISVVWNGDLFVDRDGTYRFSTAAAGDAHVWVDGQLIARPGNELGPPIRLEFGFHPIRVEYRSAGDRPGVKLFWQLNDLPREVVNARYLSHRGDEDRVAETAVAYERGRQLVEQSGCGVCHVSSGAAAASKPGPPLNRSGEIGVEYFARWLRDPQAVRPNTRMPQHELAPGKPLADADIAAIIAFVRDCPPDPETMTRLANKDHRRQSFATTLPSGSPQGGRALFQRLGCLACHDPEGSAEQGPADTPSLADVGAKWPRSSILRFLEDPTAWLPTGRMPDFRLTEMEASDLAAYLASFRKLAGDQSLHEADRQTIPWAIASSEDRAHGKQLVEQLRCAACHEIEGVATPPPAAPALSGDIGDLAVRGCIRLVTADAPTIRGRGPAPRFAFSPEDWDAVGEFLRQWPRQPAHVAALELAGRDIRERLLCMRCHTRDGHGGEQLGRALLRYAGGEAATGLQLAAATPPDLSGVGVKLRREWIDRVLAGTAPNVRPWLSVRMPQYALSDAARRRIVDRWVAADSVPESAGLPPAALQDSAVARTLLSSKGFNCQNCHYIGRYRPAADTVGPDLAHVGQRVSREWFLRWLENPARVRLGSPMPALALPVPNVADGDLAKQKEILWNYLSRTPPNEITLQTAAPRVVATSGPRTTVVQGRVLGDAPLNAVRGVAMGLPNHHSLLFDAGRLAWLGHWRGEFLREVGLHGARHHWVPGGQPIWKAAEVNPPVLFIDRSRGEWFTPAAWRDRYGWFDEVRYEPHGVRLTYRLRQSDATGLNGEGGPWVHVTEQILANPPGDSADGYTRILEIRGLPKRFDAAVPLPGDRENGSSLHDASITARPTAIVSFGGQRAALRTASQATARWVTVTPSVVQPIAQPFTDQPIQPDARFQPVRRTAQKMLAVVLSNDAAEERLHVVVQLAMQTATVNITEGPPRLWPDSGASAPVTLVTGAITSPVRVDDLSESSGFTLPPGFRIDRLPLPDDFLVCALAFWQGKLIVGGYDGELRLADDTDRDGLPDRYRYFAGQLDQVNNLGVFDGELYAATPGAVYRIRDVDGDEVADSFEVLSSAWDWSGHAFDWFFGLVRDEQGNLYGATTTPHERGDIPGLYMRGSVLKICPDGKTQRVGQGTRYNFGWAQNRAGRRYFNVNQGHWNITCGIHEVVDGSHYGFGEVDLSKVRPPVVRVPYPWCRSLTGMAFAEDVPAFGPFQGQGFAADYNTRRLIRWTDEPVGSQRQGACYPFLDGLDAGPTELAFGPDGALYVGFMSDASWYPERARGGIYRVTYSGPVPLAIRDCRATHTGFTIELTEPIDPASISPGGTASVHRYFHEYRGNYYSDEVAHEDVPIDGVELGPDRRTLLVRTAPHVTPRIYRLQLRGLRSANGRPLDNGELYYTMQIVPQ